ncbi:hypothetical protein Cgig2_031592 [Carnegiea gigantea]|uniref:Uncharacterized protein n=1 Tax=Carnegiea gigantea TaxID=171969 RepID=A0A9Q1QFC0_9CARY|nr:hypothetical protein Cgig2_031592 [Carnegiea gigantea]
MEGSDARDLVTSDCEAGEQCHGSTLVFDSSEGPYFCSSHTDPLVVDLKVANALVRRILIDIGSSVDIITWHYLQRLRYSGRKIFLLLHPILGFGEQKVNPTGMIQLPLGFRDKSIAQKLELSSRRTYFSSSTKRIMVTLESSVEINAQLGSATLSAFGHWWNAQAGVDFFSHHPRTKSRGLHFFLPPKPWLSVP